MDIIDAIKNLSVSRRRSLRNDDFLVDRLHHRYTVGLLVIFCAIITTNQYAGEPINCWVPAQFTDSFETYTNRLCWLQNTYFIEANTDIPDDSEERYKDMLKYYQWIHLIILLQSVLFLIPRILWRSLNDKCGIEIVNYVDAAMKFETVEKYPEREKLLNFLSGHINKFIEAKDSYQGRRKELGYRIKRVISFVLFWTGKRFGNYLVILYTFCKLMYLGNVFGQLFLMTRLLGIENYHTMGFEIMRRMASGKEMLPSRYFPKVTHCDFKIRELGNDHLYTVQCVLTINIFTEKIYIILWFWFAILTVITAVDLLTFLVSSALPSARYSYVKKHVLIFDRVKDFDDKKRLAEFSSKFLKPDVVLVFKIIATNVNGIVVSELIKQMWDGYRRTKSWPSLEKIVDDDEDDKKSQERDIDDEDEFTNQPKNRKKAPSPNAPPAREDDQPRRLRFLPEALKKSARPSEKDMLVKKDSDPTSTPSSSSPITNV